MDKKTFRITKVAAKVKKKTCELCDETINRGHKIAIAGTYYCDRCVVAGFLKTEARNRGFFTRLHARLTRADEAVEVSRYIEKRNQKPIVKIGKTVDASQVGQPETIEPITDGPTVTVNVNRTIN